MGRVLQHGELCDVAVCRYVPRNGARGDAATPYARPMISYGPFKAAHLYELNVQEAQRWTMAYLEPNIATGLETLWSNTVFKDGRPICCGGVIAQRADYGILWSFVGSDVTPHDFPILHRLVKAFVGALPFRRLEMH